MLTTFIIISILEFILLLVSVYAVWRFANVSMKLEDYVSNLQEQVEESLDILDDSYRTIVTVAGLEVASDEPFVKRVVDAINNARVAVGQVAVKISSLDESETEPTRENNAGDQTTNDKKEKEDEAA